MMYSDFESTTNEISEVTRRAIIDHFSIANVSWAGRLQDDEFLARLFDLSKMPSFDPRCNDAAGDIYQHCVRNNDWDTDWVFCDPRFNLMYAPDAEFLRFLCETVHPIVRPAKDDVGALVHVYNNALAPDGWQIVEGKAVSGRPIFVPQSGRRAVVFDEPTGWQKVDRQLQEMRLRLDSGETEEQYQSVGLLCREVLISVAQEVYDPACHPIVDGSIPSDTDVKRMLEAIFEAELKGSSNEEARAHAKAAVRMALALQHKRLADFRTAALCAEGTWSVVNMLAIIAGQRGRRNT
jgi:AbiJ N-terminal domain 3